jgi:hypothetical protein
MINVQPFLRLPELQGIAIELTACALAADLIIAGVMCFLLHTSRTGIRL